MELRRCEACGREREVGVACYPYGAISFAYCIECLQNNAHPRWALEGTVLECQGWDGVYEGFGEDNYWYEPRDGKYHQAKEIVVTKEDVDKFWKEFEAACAKVKEPTGDEL